MQTLSNGYKLPDTGDFGDEWFPALEDNITRVNGHTHDGTDSEQLNTQNILGIPQTVVAGSFSVDGDRFSALVTLAGGSVDIDNKSVQVRDITTKNTLFMEIEKITNTQIKVYTPIVRDIEVLVV